MDSEQADRLVAALRARGVMAHRAEAGVYEFGVRVVIDEGVEAVWSTDGAAGLEAEVLRDGVLIGYVPHVPGSEDFTDEQCVDSIAGAVYSEEGLHPPADTPEAGPSRRTGPRPAAETPPERRRGRRWWRR